jgi:site-specific DNA-methyltransferase (adenine-specific)
MAFEIIGYKDKHEYISKGMKSTVYLIDCLDAMRQIPDKEFSLSLVDPPYGINVAKMAYTQEENRPCKQLNGSMLKVKKKKYKHEEWDKKPADKTYLDELIRVSKNQIIWGINYMNFHLIGGRIIWNKLVPEGVSFSDCEIAYCSIIERVEIVYYRWAGMIQGIYCGKNIEQALIQQGNKQLNESRIHPTQKPIALYDWIYDKYLPQGGKVLDTHLGSQSNRISAFKRGNIDFTAFELDSDYFRDGNARFDAFVAKYEPASEIDKTADGQFKMF